MQIQTAIESLKALRAQIRGAVSTRRWENLLHRKTVGDLLLSLAQGCVRFNHVTIADAVGLFFAWSVDDTSWFRSGRQ